VTGPITPTGPGSSTGPVPTSPVGYLNAHFFAVQPTSTILRRGAWSLCHGCSNNLHQQHVPVNCQCDLCVDAVPEQAILELETG
jgi:hypothetical protein